MLPSKSLLLPMRLSASAAFPPDFPLPSGVAVTPIGTEIFAGGQIATEVLPGSTIALQEDCSSKGCFVLLARGCGRIFGEGDESGNVPQDGSKVTKVAAFPLRRGRADGDYRPPQLALSGCLGTSVRNE